MNYFWRGILLGSIAMQLWGCHDQGTLATRDSGSIAGTALSLNGTSAYVEVPHSASLDGIDSSVTMEAWIKPKDRYYNTVVCKGSAAYGIEPVMMQVASLFIQVQFVTPYEMNYWGHILSPYTLTDSTWAHIAVVFSSRLGKLRYYVDGNLVVEYASQGQMTAGTSPLRIGARADSAYTEYYGGIIDEVRIWKVARTQSEIQSTMRKPLVGNENGLVGYWDFNAVSPQGVVKDKSLYHNDGLLQGGAGIVRSDCY